MDEVVEEINDKHMGPWLEICQKDGIENTPLTPYMDEELLFHKHLNLDNGKLKQAGYVLRVPTVKRESIEEVSLVFLVRSHRLISVDLKFNSNRIFFSRSS